MNEEISWLRAKNDIAICKINDQRMKKQIRKFGDFLRLRQMEADLPDLKTGPVAFLMIKTKFVDSNYEKKVFFDLRKEMSNHFLTI
jgi:hypothetical protein